MGMVIVLISLLFLLILRVTIVVWHDMRFKEREYQAESKLTNINDLHYLKNNNSDEFIKEAEFILKYLKNKRYSEFYEFCYSRSKHNKGYYIIGYTNITNSKRCFPCYNIMGGYAYPDYYLKDMNEVNSYYIDLLWRELVNMNKEKKRYDEYDERREF